MKGFAEEPKPRKMETVMETDLEVDRIRTGITTSKRTIRIWECLCMKPHNLLKTEFTGDSRRSQCVSTQLLSPRH